MDLRILRYRLLFIWICFICRGLFYCSLLPLWDGFDEWAHFAVIERMSTSRSLLIDRNSPVSREIDASLSLAPLPRGMTSIPPQGVVREDYWRLATEERSRRETELAHLPPQWAADYPGGGMPAYEASQAPLYYWIMAVPASGLRQLPLIDRVWSIRILTLLLGSLCIPIGFVTARKFFGNDRIALGITTAIALLPELALTVSRVSNESLAIVAYTGLFLAGMAWIEKPALGKAILAGIVLGLALLTKAYVLTAVPALFLTFMFLAIVDRERRRSILRQAALAAAIASVLSAWWYLRTYLQTGTISGLDEAIMLKGTGMTEKLYALFRVEWWPALRTILSSHVWYGGWNLVGLRRWIYVFWLGVMAIVGFGFIKTIREPQPPRFFLLLSLYTFFWIGQGYQVTALLLSKGVSTSMGGWYLYSVIWAEVILAVVCLRSLMSAALGRAVFAILLVAIAVTDMYGVHSALIPYYASAGSSSWDLSRLLINQPQLLGQNGLFVLWGFYVVATVAMVVTGCFRQRSPLETAQRAGIGN